MGRFFIIAFTNVLFFLPPPQIKILSMLIFFFDKNFDKDSPIILAVNSVNVAAPSSVESPRTNPKSKSLMSYDELMGLNCSLSRLSCKICLFISPRLAIFPWSSNFKDVFGLIQLSIRQLPGPISLLYISAEPICSLIIV